MTAGWVLCAVGLWCGTTLLLDQVARIARPPLIARIAPYLPGAWRAPRRVGPGEGLMAIAQDAVATRLGARLDTLPGVGESLADRLERIHHRWSASDARAIEVRLAAGAVAAAALVATALRPAPAATVGVLVTAPLGAIAALEAWVAHAARRWQQRTFLELPTVCEHLAMLLGAGYSLGAALVRIADRGEGACRQDLALVVARIGQGLDEHAALREWAQRVQVPPVDALVGVLGLNRHTGDLGRLITAQATAVRAEVHRTLTAEVRRKAQQVWIPVTVATLVPGAIFLAVPFLQALSTFSAQ